mgnify:CR=1 FL=1
MSTDRRVLAKISEKHGRSCITQIERLEGSLPVQGEILVDPNTGKEWKVLGGPIGCSPTENFDAPALRGIGHEDPPNDNSVLIVRNEISDSPLE